MIVGASTVSMPPIYFALLRPAGSKLEGWPEFPSAAILLQQGLRINLAGIALALDLIGEIEKAREYLWRLEMPDGS